MQVETLIKRLERVITDVKEHRADYCYIKIDGVEAIIEYLKQFREIAYIP